MPFKIITATAPPLSLTVPITMIGVGMNTNDKILTRQGVIAGASVFLSVGLTAGLKYTIQRKRPFVTYDDIQKESDVGPFSFPSGHTSTAFATATALSLAFPKWYVIVPSYLWACTVAYSRMHLGVHYPTDVLVGILIGIGSSLLCYQAQYWTQP